MKHNITYPYLTILPILTESLTAEVVKKDKGGKKPKRGLTRDASSSSMGGPSSGSLTARGGKGTLRSQIRANIEGRADLAGGMGE